METIIEDKREITGLLTMNGWTYLSDSGMSFDVTKIVPYHENGQMAPIVWFALYNNEKIIGRINGGHVIEIKYA